MSQKLKVAILGTGNIGTDLLIKALRSPLLECTLFAGRNMASRGMVKANRLGVPLSDEGIAAIKAAPGLCDLMFDCTSAISHTEHAKVAQELGILMIDLTPSNLGVMCVPAINLDDCIQAREVSMITCGGQASTPLAWAIGRTQKNVEYIETVSSIASRSAGPATRLNLDEYIGTTKRGLATFSGTAKTKAILNLNPAEPCIHMQATVFAKVKDPDMAALKREVDRIVAVTGAYVPGYKLLVDPVYEDGRIVITVRVSGLGDYLPEYAGNLDIINCAAIAAAEGYARARNANNVIGMTRHG